MTHLIGLSSSARAGKDTFSHYLGDLLRAQGRTYSPFAFANALKAELDPMFRAFGATAYETDTARKDLIRPILVAYGCAKRLTTDGRYWIERIEGNVRGALAAGEVVAITDVRFPNEVDWIHALGGKVIYIERELPGGSIVPPANAEEAENTPHLMARADALLRWPTFLPNSLDNARPYVENAWRDLNR